MTIWGTGKGAGFGTKPNSERSNSAERKESPMGGKSR